MSGKSLTIKNSPRPRVLSSPRHSYRKYLGEPDIISRSARIGYPPRGRVEGEVPATPIAPTPQVGQQPTPYDYLTLLPALITAVTPLILGLKNKGKKDEDQNDSSK